MARGDNLSEPDRPADWKRAWTAAELGRELSSQIVVADIPLDQRSLPAGLRVDREPGLLLFSGLKSHVLHRWPAPFHKVDATRGMITPGGDYVVFVCGGREQYGIPPALWRDRLNNLLIYRSQDRGQTWSTPEVAWRVAYPTAPVVPFVPHGSQRIYLFDTEPIPNLRVPKEDGPIGYRFSDDDGHSWSAWQRIAPTNDPDFVGISQMRMCETPQGAWLLGTHGGSKVKTKEGPELARQQYVLRSEDQGRTWTLLPGRRNTGWYGVQPSSGEAKSPIVRLQEGEFLTLADSSVLAMVRSAEGHLWELRSRDNGDTWIGPTRTALVHPDAPPMVYTLSDGRTLLALVHNRYTAANPLFNQEDRTELWCCVSSDLGTTWSEPRFLLRNMTTHVRRPNTSYTDVFVDNGVINFVMPHLWEEVLTLQLRESDLAQLPRKADLLAPAFRHEPGALAPIH